jgi:deoxyribodipyrimidine photo-lyase
VYILDEETPGDWKLGGGARWWLHHSLGALSANLASKGATLVLRRGSPEAILPSLVRETGAGAVHWNRCYEPSAIARDTRLKATLGGDGVAVESANSALLFEPWQLKTAAGGPFKVYSPFWRALRAAGGVAPPQPAPTRIAIPSRPPESDRLDSWGLLPSRPDWAGGLRESWTPGETGARARLDNFLDTALAGYGEARNRPDLPSTSRLSPHLHWGEIGPRQVWAAVHAFAEAHTQVRADADKFLSEIAWREFAHHLLFHRPDLPERNWKASFDGFPWATDETSINSWQRGQTGYPIVDAGMRELWTTGWMHNRVRMIVASFLVKDLMIHWRRGEDWFWDTLVDADLANNAASWQWVAGSGADAAPYFRVFNPVTQGERFDPQGAYVGGTTVVRNVDPADPARKTLLVDWYRQMARVAEELAMLEHVAADSGRPFPAIPTAAADLGGRVLATPQLADDLARLARNWLAYSRRDGDGVVMPATLSAARRVGPYWCSRVAIAEAGGASRELSVISRIEPTALPGDAIIVMGLVMDGGVLWASDVRSATAVAPAAAVEPDPFGQPGL